MKEKILITVKTYPTLSKTYAELVCTAGVNEAGEWRRLYPVQFRQLHEEQQYRKFQWVEADISKSTRDVRPESYKVLQETLKVVDEPFFRKEKVRRERRINFATNIQSYDDMTLLTSLAHNNEISLALFQPTEIIDFVCEAEDKNWNPEYLRKLENDKQQLNLLKDTSTVEEDFKVVNKLPYKFSYRFRDIDGKDSKRMIEDWEIGALYWNCLRASDGNEEMACKKVRDKYWDDYIKSGKYDIMLILGTTEEAHRRKWSEQFIIIGVVPLPVNLQSALFPRL